jgi:hypothetical protein
MLGGMVNGKHREISRAGGSSVYAAETIVVELGDLDSAVSAMMSALD